MLKRLTTSFKVGLCLGFLSCFRDTLARDEYMINILSPHASLFNVPLRVVCFDRNRIYRVVDFRFVTLALTCIARSPTPMLFVGNPSVKLNAALIRIKSPSHVRFNESSFLQIVGISNSVDPTVRPHYRRKYLFLRKSRITQIPGFLYSPFPNVYW